MLTVVDSSSNSIVKSIYVGRRSFKIAMSNNKIYVPCDRDNNIAVVDCLSYEVTFIDIPNDGNIEIDELNKRVFISNTSEIVIYDLCTNKIYAKITGFLAITDFKLNKDKSKLYVLDRLVKDFKIYNTDDFKIIYRAKNVGINPEYVILSDDENTAYISFECSEVNAKQYSILKIDINLKSLSGLILPVGSKISGMVIRGDTLYAANKGLNRIELIDVKTFKDYEFISTSLPEPTRIFQADGTKLLITNRNSAGTGSIDIIDTADNRKIGEILMDSYDSQPYDIAITTLELLDIEDVSDDETELCASEDDKAMIIITKRVFANYNRRIKFPEVIVRISDNKSTSYIFEGIKFRKGFIVKDSEVRVPVEGKINTLRIDFLIRITYTINFKDEIGNRYSREGFLEKFQDILFETPNGRDNSEFQTFVETSSEVTRIHSLDNILRFEVLTSIGIKMIGDDMISLPAVKYNSKSQNQKNLSENAEESFRIFDGYSIPLFPQDIIFQYLHKVRE